VSGPGSLEALVEQLLARVAELETAVVQRDRRVAELEMMVVQRDRRVAELEAGLIVRDERIAELQRQAGVDSSNSSRPPSSDPPWEKKAAKKRSSRSRSGRKPGKQPGSSSVSRRLSDDPDAVFEVAADRCVKCEKSLHGAEETSRVRRQVVDVSPPPPPTVTEYQMVSRRCGGCGHVSEPTATDVPREVTPETTTDGPDGPDGPDGEYRGEPGTACEPGERAESAAAGGPGERADAGVALVLRRGAPVRIGPYATALAALLTCGHYLPVARATALLKAMTGIGVSTGLVAGVRGRAATVLETVFLPHMRALLRTAPVLHADETTGRAAGALSYVHVACTEYLTLMHVGSRSAVDIDAGGVLPEFTGVLMRDGYSGYAHLPSLHAWCAAHLLRDLRAISDADPDGQIWASAMASTLLDANQAAHHARATGAEALEPVVLKRIRSHYLGAIAKGTTDNTGRRGSLAAEARTLLRRFIRYEDMILRFTVDLSVPFTNNVAERSVRPVKVQQRTSGGCWRTLRGLADFAVVHSYLDTATKWGLDKLDVLQQLFTTGAWLPPTLTPTLE
jgi:transposase